MSLQVWLPLNGNLKNYGVGDLTTASVQSGVVIDDNSKIGKCYTNSGSNTCVSTPIVFNSNQFSLCSWVKVNSRRNNWCKALGLAGSGTYIGLGCEHTNSSSYGFHFYKTIDGNNTTIFDTYPLHSQNGTWVHYAMCYDGVKYYIYQNGTLIKSGNTNKTNIPVNMTSLLLFGGVNGNYSNCSLNDVRLYDECISPKIVKEISKGLVCHYPLKSQYETGQVNKYSGDVAEGSLNANQFTKTKLEGERGYNYKLSYTGTGGNMWFNMNTGYFSFTAGKKYYYSCKVRCHSKNFNIQLRASRSPNDWVTNNINVLNPDGEWHEYVVSQTINSTYDRAGSTVTCNPILEFYSENLVISGKVYSADFDIKDVQVVESDCYVPFIDNDMVSNVVSDCSGYGNNGIKVGDIAWSGDTARYSGSYNFNGTGYIKNSSFNYNATEMTISFWLKIPRTITNQHFLFGTFNSWTGNGIGYYRDTNTSHYSGILRSSAESSYVGLPTPALTANTWYHIVIVYTGTECILYVNGVENKRVTYGKNGIITNPVCYLGNSLYKNTPSSETDESSMSDFRIYATALSAEDVKELYSVSASIDKTGVLSAYEFVEEG